MGLALARHSGTLNYKVGARFMELGEGVFEMIRHLAEIKTVNVRCLLENFVNPLNAKLNPICHLLTSLGAHHIIHVSKIRVKEDHLERQEKGQEEVGKRDCRSVSVQFMAVFDCIKKRKA
jgi:hypothetical protein